MSLSCPSCGATMSPLNLAGLYGRTVTVDLCAGCRMIWFDGRESLQLTAGGTLELFRTLGAISEERKPVAARLPCPRCRRILTPASDAQRSTRFHYWKCRLGHGRLITFFQFLREKNFVRSLAPAEVAELRRRLHQIGCSNCGAPIDLQHDAVCGFCRTPVSMLDPDQLSKTIAALQAAEAEREARAADPLLPMRLLEARVETERAFAAAGDQRQLLTLLQDAPSLGLVEAGVNAVGRLLSRLGGR